MNKNDVSNLLLEELEEVLKEFKNFLINGRDHDLEKYLELQDKIYNLTKFINELPDIGVVEDILKQTGTSDLV